METIPNIITNKDMCYLKDLFYKNYYLYLELDNIVNSVKNKEIKEFLIRIKNLHEDHMFFIISSLKKENMFDGDIYE